MAASVFKMIKSAIVLVVRAEKIGQLIDKADNPLRDWKIKANETLPCMRRKCL